MTRENNADLEQQNDTVAFQLLRAQYLGLESFSQR